jgi:hypothetical protein
MATWKRALLSGIECFPGQQRFESRQHALELMEQAFRARSSLIGAAVADEKFVAERFAKPLQRPAHRWLAEKAALCSPGDNTPPAYAVSSVLLPPIESKEQSSHDD